MFVDAQKQLSDLKADRRRLYRDTATQLVADIVKIMDRKFADLDKRYISFNIVLAIVLNAIFNPFVIVERKIRTFFLLSEWNSLPSCF